MRVGDFFCGAGGASEGMRQAGHTIVFAVNHSKDAIAAHAQNHPDTKHFNEDVRDVDPYMLRDDYPVDAIWWSAECTHLSNAKGGSSRDADSRMLSEHLVHYAYVNRWGRIYVENVKEIRTWGPLVPKTVKPTKPHSIQRKLELDYCRVQMRLMDAICTDDKSGQATAKTELDTLINQLDGYENYKREKGELVMAPEPTLKGTMYDRWITHMTNLGYRHEFKVLNYTDYGGAQRRERYFAVFRHETVKGEIAWPVQTHTQLDSKGVVKKAGLTPWRCAKELLDLEDRGESIFSGKVGQRGKGGKRIPLSTKTLQRIAGGIAAFGPGDVMMIDRYHSGSTPADAEGEPMPTLMAAMDKGVVSVGMIDNYAHDAPLAPLNAPLGTLMASKEKSVTTAFIVPSNFTNKATSLLQPLPTMLASRKHMAVAQCSFIASEYSQGGQLNGLDEPLPSVMTVPKSRLTTAFLAKYHGQGKNLIALTEPMSTCTTKDRLALITATLCQGAKLVGYVLRHAPLPTAKGNVVHPSWCRIVGDYLVDNRIVDIKYRLLKVSEGMRAQGFPEGYFINVKATKAKWMIGNAVPVDMARLITGADGFGVENERVKLAS